MYMYNTHVHVTREYMYLNNTIVEMMQYLTIR